jgi:transposase
VTKLRKHFTAEEKVAILRRRLLEQVPVSDLCDEYGIQPSVFYRWQQQLFENGAAAFDRQSKSASGPTSEKIKSLEEKLVRKNEVLSELMEEYVKVKKELGDA